jgi:hypothetical protein
MGKHINLLQKLIDSTLLLSALPATMKHFAAEPDFVLEPRETIGRRARRTRARLERFGLEPEMPAAPRRVQQRTQARRDIHAERLRVAENAIAGLPSHLADIILDQTDILRPKVLFVGA